RPAAVDAGRGQGEGQGPHGASRDRREPPCPGPGRQAGRGPRGRVLRTVTETQMATEPDVTGSRAGTPGHHRLVVLAGPTAVGKGTVAATVRAAHPEVWISVSATTRKPRP